MRSIGSLGRSLEILGLIVVGGFYGGGRIVFVELGGVVLVGMGFGFFRVGRGFIVFREGENL